MYKKIKNINNLYITLGVSYWMNDSNFTPIKVRVLSLDFKYNKVNIGQDWVGVDLLFKRKNECPKK